MQTSYAMLAALDKLVLQRRDSGGFVALGETPAWFGVLTAGAVPRGEFRAETLFPFLELFLAEAARAWAPDARGRVDSDCWTETAPSGDELHLEATALRAAGASLLVITRNDALYRERQLMLQRARELRLAHDALARTSEDNDVLVHCVVHDLANPLSAIISALDALRERVARPDETELVQIALEAAARQQGLIREILDVYATERGAASRTASATTTADLRGVLGAAIAAAEPEARGRNVRLDAARALAGPPTAVAAEPERLLRVLANLLENALRYSPSGSTVAVTLEREEGEFVLGVEDAGPGVPDWLRARLFEKFARAHDSSRGTGLGLYFCRIMVERWGGRIGYAPRSSHGSRFWIRLRKAESFAHP